MTMRAAYTLLIVISIFNATCRSSEEHPAEKKSKAVPGLKALGASGRLNVSDSDRCPVCAMVVSKHPKFNSAIALEDGTTYYFCGTGCMIKSWLHPEIYLGVVRADLKKAYTKDYFEGKPLDALEARWVAGSDVVGPMGPALVPLKDDAHLATFKKRHGGAHTFSLKNLTDEEFRAITGKSPAPVK
jgi:nitrous oxide reductase accessory protein NosL